ncbi:MAG TPA: PilZ domain-containing protein [Myxococcales bacterium]|jgi:hypothetical protein
MNNRRHQRHRAANVAAHMRMENRIALCKVEDISESGVFIRTDESLPLGLAVSVDLAQPGLKKALRLTGKVARQASRGKVGIGIHFDGLDADTRARLVQLITELGRDKTSPTRPELIEVPETPLPPTREVTEDDLLEEPPAIGPARAAAAPDQAKLFIQVRGLLMELGSRDEALRQKDAEIAALKAEVEELRADARMQRAAGGSAGDGSALRREADQIAEHAQALRKLLGRS